MMPPSLQEIQLLDPKKEIGRNVQVWSRSCRSLAQSDFFRGHLIFPHSVLLAYYTEVTEGTSMVFLSCPPCLAPDEIIGEVASVTPR